MSIQSFPAKEDLKETVTATLLYLGLYVCFVSYQAFSKFYLLSQKKQEYYQSKHNEKKDDGYKATVVEKPCFRQVKYYNSIDNIALNGDRAAGNFLEWSFVFLSTLWMYAIFVDAKLSYNLALLYIGFRSIYPFTFYYGIPYVFISTVPQYCVLMYMQYEIITKFISD